MGISGFLMLAALIVAVAGWYFGRPSPDVTMKGFVGDLGNGLVRLLAYAVAAALAVAGLIVVLFG